jgi:beta-lactamase superfamily II metal-dependent hydrolase
MSTSVTVKMYKVGELGDCFLLRFKHADVSRHMLIDCGSFRNSDKSAARLQEITRDIKKQVKDGKLDIVVGTHQHNDHVSGFVHAEEIFREIGVGQVWLSWLDNPRNKQATRIGESHLELRKSLKSASDKLQALSKTQKKKKGTTPSARKMTATKSLIDDLLGFFGAAPELPSKGIEILKNIGANPAEYLSPGDLKRLSGIPENAIRIHVLGPPKDEDLLYRKDPKKGESYDHKLKAMHAMAGHFLLALNNRSKGNNKEEEQFPFNRDYKRFADKPGNFSPAMEAIVKTYSRTDNDWRNIDNDWLEQAARLALYMDSYTNNSSLVLAIELVKTGKVLLFAADAQIGNWVSWGDVKFKDKNTSTDSLLERTVLYKAGHHGSHNSTLKNGLEKMTSDQLVVMIPVDKSDSNIVKENGWKMPAANLFKRLKEKTNLRVLRMDDGYADGCDPKKNATAKASWDELPHQPKIHKLYVEYTVS